MALTLPNGTVIEIDQEGFIKDPALWTEEIAKAFAKLEGIEELTDEHWAIINFIREYYLENELAPMIRKMCKASSVSLKKIYELFPAGPAKGACKWAGLPKPDGCV